LPPPLRAKRPGRQSRERPILEPRDAQYKVGAHSHAAPLADDETHHARTHSDDRHEINDRDVAFAALEMRFEG
jgi:hypothetical protein